MLFPLFDLRNKRPHFFSVNEQQTMTSFHCYFFTEKNPTKFNGNNRCGKGSIPRPIKSDFDAYGLPLLRCFFKATVPRRYAVEMDPAACYTLRSNAARIKRFYITKLCKAQDSNKIQNFKNFSTYTTLISYHSIIGIS